MNTIHPEDSLDNLSNLQINRQRQLQAQVKQQFAAGLQKLQSPQTREGISELKRIIQQYRQQEYLRGYLALLKALKPNSNSGTKQHQILTISLLAQTYKKQLLDPLDKPPSLLKSAFRVVQILHGYFNDHSPTVQQACARALLDLNTHCLGQQPLQTRFSIIYAPLISILKSGVDKGSQATASACLSELIHYNRRIGDEQLLRRLSPQMLGVILKVNSEYHELFHAILGMLQSQELNFLDGKIVAFLSKILSVIDGSREVSSANTTNLNTYMCKVNVCKILEKVAKLLPPTQRQKLYELRIPESLQQAARHRIIQVQLAAGKALKAWRGEQVQDSPPKNQGRGLTSLQQKRNTKKLQRSKSKEERDKMESQLTFMKEDLQKLVKGGWGASNRAKNYVKKGSGIGGGFHGRSEVSPTSKSPGKSHKQHFEELRQFIKKSAQENKNLDRFAQVRSQGQKRSKSPPARSKSPPSRGKSPSRPEQKKKSNSKKSQDAEIGFKEDEGQQMVYMPYQRSEQSKSVKSNQERYPKAPDAVKNSHFKELGISQAEARQLMDHEQSLIDEGKKMNIKYTEMSQNFTVGKPQNNPNIDQMYIPLNKNDKERTKNEKSNTTKEQQKFKGISEQQIGELVEEYNLSQVSENLNSILNESDFKAFKNSENEMVDSNILPPGQGKSDILALKQMIADKKQRKSGITKFMKKEEEVQPPKPVQVQPVQKETVEEVGQSLNFTVSNQSKAKSPIKRQEIQFTLNPKDRFSTLKEQPNHEKQKQIQQQIAMSEYEESFPRDNPLPMILPKVAPITQIPLRHSIAPSKVDKKESQPQDRAEYQKLIKNPPKREVNSQLTALKGSKATVKSQIPKSNFSAQKQENEDIKDKWFQIVRQAESGEANTAYELALELDDPIYLLRLMLINKLQMKKLSPQTVRQLWRKFMEMYSQRFIDILTVGLLTQGNDLGLLTKCLSVQEIQDALVGLYELSGNTKGKLSYKAATLYNEIEKNIHGN